ncbi:MAG: Crp/Fnr family transcriptional regulator [Coriobacteriia bacterium]
MRLESRGGSVKRYSDGDVIFREGDAGEYLYLVVSGAVRIKKEGTLVATVVAELGPGEMFGESAIIEQRPRSASALSVGETELACYDREAFLSALQDDPELALRAMSDLIDRLRVTTQRLQHLATQHVLDRAEMTLTERAILESDVT